MESQYLNSEEIRSPNLQLSIHYYVLSLSKQICKLYEGFRDKLIEIQDMKFPVKSSIDASSSIKLASNETQLKILFHQTDQHFAHYYKQDPHRFVVAGEKRNLAIFKTLTTCPDALNFTVEGDYSNTSTHDLGKIVWPVVKDIIAGSNQNAIRDLVFAAKAKKVVSGIEAVGLSAETETGSTLYVEENYHVEGSILKTDRSLILSKAVNLWEVLDNVVDIIIEKVLKMGGTVVFLNNGSLVNLERIALILRD